MELGGGGGGGCVLVSCIMKSLHSQTILFTFAAIFCSTNKSPDPHKSCYVSENYGLHVGRE